MELFKSQEYTDQTHIFVLTQTLVWEYVVHLYGLKGEQKVVTLIDKALVAGIIFCEDMCQFEGKFCACHAWSCLLMKLMVRECLNSFESLIQTVMHKLNNTTQP